MAKMTETEVAAFRAKSLEMREACGKLIAENDAILHAGGELMSAMFQSQQEIRGIPSAGY